MRGQRAAAETRRIVGDMTQFAEEIRNERSCYAAERRVNIRIVAAELVTE